ncbi:tetratricopeptide repeat protein [Polynucleobacter paneuropaeus]|nr:tetratricopeptide repeat protein [Polynucleobacter paneuropaeus]
MNNFELAKKYFLEGYAFLKAEDFSQAESKFKKSLELAPDRTSTLTNLSATQLKLKKYSEAKATAEKSILIDNSNSEAYLNLGLIEKEFKKLESAVNFFDKALSLNPEYPEAWSNKGVTLNELKRYDEAIVHYDKALSLNPEYPEAWSNKGLTLHKLKRYEEAISHYDKALSLSPYEASYFYQKSFTNIALNQYSLAIENLQNAMKYNYCPKEYAEYVLSSLRHENGFKPMPKNFVAELFDDYADSFDKHLVGILKYEAPKKLLDLLNLSINDRFEILDIGCGTGLMGKLLKPYASKIVGVDLSKEMLSRAELTGVYNELIVDDILEFLNKCNDKFDLVVSSDVFIYIGELSNIFIGLAKVIKSGGLFCFSVEKNEARTFSLSPRTLRYSHSMDYIRKLACIHNFKIENILESPIRQENHVDIEGYFFCLKKICQ